MNFSTEIIQWYNQHRRDLPWRETTDPYVIWLSEIILQQTRVNQGMEYFINFLTHFPTVHDLADASEEKVLKLWQGLGYYNRARNLHFTAKDISENYAGKFPNNFIDLKKLKGVGDYTAAAIASFSFKQKVPVVDGNVYRVLSRFFSESTPINTGAGQKLFFSIAYELISEKHPDTFNQAIMEFGALQCTPKNPDCNSCIFKNQCAAFSQNKVGQFPVKKGKTKVSNLFLTFFVIEMDEKLMFVQRSDKSIWANLYEFPNLESKEPIKFEDALDYFRAHYSESNFEAKEDKVLRHKLSHRSIEANFIEIKNATLASSIKENFQWFNPEQMQVGVHKLIEKYLLETQRI